VLSNKTEKESGDFQQGHFIIPKGKHGMEDEYFSPGSSRKGSGVTKPPYRTRGGGGASGMGFEVRAIEREEIISICTSKIKIDQFKLPEDCNKAAYSKTVQLLIKDQPDGTKYPPALDAIKGTNFLHD
jgi:antiviral helicase SKI2